MECEAGHVPCAPPRALPPARTPTAGREAVKGVGGSGHIRQRMTTLAGTPLDPNAPTFTPGASEHGVVTVSTDPPPPPPPAALHRGTWAGPGGVRVVPRGRVRDICRESFVRRKHVCCHACLLPCDTRTQTRLSGVCPHLCVCPQHHDGWHFCRHHLQDMSRNISFGSQVRCPCPTCPAFFDGLDGGAPPNQHRTC